MPCGTKPDRVETPGATSCPWAARTRLKDKTPTHAEISPTSYFIAAEVPDERVWTRSALRWKVVGCLRGFGNLGSRGGLFRGEGGWLKGGWVTDTLFFASFPRTYYSLMSWSLMFSSVFVYFLVCFVFCAD